jgi:hypothetical protein
MTEAITHSDSSVTGRMTKFVLSSDTSRRPISGPACINVSNNLEWGGIGGGSRSLIYEIVPFSKGTGTNRSGLPPTGSLYANTVSYGLLSHSDVDTIPLGVLHAEEFDPQEFHDLGEQQTLLAPSRAIIEASEFLPATLLSFSESLIELLYGEARSFDVPILEYEWSVFADPEDLGKELVLGVTVNATSDRALEFWDKVSEKVSAKKQLLSPEDQNALSKHLSVQIYWP